MPSNGKVTANPFQTGGMIRHEDKFFGREAELRQIFSRLASMQSVSIVGERRMGKSSLLWRITEIGKERLGDSFEIFYLDLERIFSAEEFYEQACKLLKREEGSTHAGLAEAISKRQVIFCLDEFEQTDEENFDTDFFKSLRSLAQTGELALVVATQHPLSQLYQRHGNQTSPFQNIFTQLTLGDFTPDEARQMVSKPYNGYSFNSDEINFLLGIANNHPYWLNVASAKLFDAKQLGGKVDFDSIKQQITEERKTAAASAAKGADKPTQPFSAPTVPPIKTGFVAPESKPAPQSNLVILGLVALFTFVGGITGWLAMQQSNPIGVIIAAAFLSTALVLFLYDFLKLILHRRRV